MALNKTILMKLKQKTDLEPDLAEFLVSLFEFEAEPRGWYNKVYSDVLEKSCKEAQSDANNKN